MRFTTKRVSWKTALVELTWMLSGDTNIRYLKDHGVSIWDAWADDNGRAIKGQPLCVQHGVRLIARGLHDLIHHPSTAKELRP